MGLIGGYCMFDIFINGNKVGTNLSEDGILIALNQLVNTGSNSFEEITIKKQKEKQRIELSPEEFAFGPDDVVGGGTLSPYTRSNKQKVELIDKYDTVKRVNRIIAEETKNIDENSSYDEVLHAVKVLRTEVGDVIKGLPTVEFEK